MDWIDLNPKYKNAGKSVAKGAKTIGSSTAKVRQVTSTKAVREKIQKKFPTRSRSDVWMGETTRSGTSRWDAVRDSVVNKRAKREQPTSKWVDIPQKDLVKLPSFEEGNSDNQKPILAQKRVYENVGKRGIFWTGKYTGKKIIDSKLLDVDHLVSKFRAQGSEFMGNPAFKTLKQKYAFIRDTKNLFISTRAENRDVKKGYGLKKYVPPLKEVRPEYAQTYHDVFEQYGMKMTVGEAAKYTEYTGKKPTVGLWNQEESDKINTFMDVERAKTEKRIKMRTRP